MKQQQQKPTDFSFFLHFRGKLMTCNVLLLDDTSTTFQVGILGPSPSCIWLHDAFYSQDGRGLLWLSFENSVSFSPNLSDCVCSYFSLPTITTITTTTPHLLPLPLPHPQVGNKALGGDLFDLVVQHLNLLEYDYFGLEHVVPNQKWDYWIEAEKPILKQVR